MIDFEKEAKEEAEKKKVASYVESVENSPLLNKHNIKAVDIKRFKPIPSWLDVTYKLSIIILLLALIASISYLSYEGYFKADNNIMNNNTNYYSPQNTFNQPVTNNNNPNLYLNATVIIRVDNIIVNGSN